MMYLPAIFGESLMDDWMDDFDRSFRSFDRILTLGGAAWKIIF